jgi:hypothetical protein
MVSQAVTLLRQGARPERFEPINGRRESMIDQGCATTSHPEVERVVVGL